MILLFKYLSSYKTLTRDIRGYWQIEKTNYEQ